MDRSRGLLQDRLKDVIYNRSYPIRIRKELITYYNQLVSGIMPPTRRIYDLLAELREVDGCANLQPDGACPWLRMHAEKEGLRKPLPGERVYCFRAKNIAAKQSMLGCEGYKEFSVDDL